MSKIFSTSSESQGAGPVTLPKINVVVHNNKYTGFSYYEYKYLVTHERLEQTRRVLDEFAGHTDPFPCGIVDSIYYDTMDEKLMGQCINGDADKAKFRIRGYGDGHYNQIHQKLKVLSSVSKYKCGIKLVGANREICPEWESLAPRDPNHPDFHKIIHNSRRYGQMLPSIRVKYFRYRYRSYDYRITLDTNIEVFQPLNGIPKKLNYATLPHHVLEIKTTDVRPKLPFLGLVKLPQISFSKFMIGLMLLNQE